MIFLFINPIKRILKTMLIYIWNSQALIYINNSLINNMLNRCKKIICSPGFLTSVLVGIIAYIIRLIMLKCSCLDLFDI
jgi:hypothetical protein